MNLQFTQLTRAFTNTKSLFEEDFSFSCKSSYLLPFYFSIYFFFLCVLFSLALLSSLYLYSTSKSLLGIGRFAYMVNSEEGVESFKALYRIPPGVGIRYCKKGEWHEKRQERKVVIPMIVFIEGGMRNPYGYHYQRLP